MKLGRLGKGVPLAPLCCYSHLGVRACAAQGKPPLGLIWLLPSGRFALWAVSTLCLAFLLTFLPALHDSANHFGVPDGVILLYILGIFDVELRQILRLNRNYGQIQEYLGDPFNIMDLLAVIFMAVMSAARITIDSSPSLAEAAVDPSAPSLLILTAVTAQAFAALVVWMRLLQILFVFPSTGPLLLMTLRMLDDLWKVRSCEIVRDRERS